jgi:hypothetical protein
MASMKNKSLSDRDIVRKYEEMPIANIDKELRDLGINPQNTINAVQAMVSRKLTEWRERGLLHTQEAVGALQGAGATAPDVARGVLPFTSLAHQTAPRRGLVMHWE